eukprot:15365949-Ditylum_brightwellii.AAC.1
MTMQPASVSCATKNRAYLCRGGRTWPQHACTGSIGIKHMVVAADHHRTAVGADIHPCVVVVVG